jgi:Spy/CpxP family protein refolding chaperone
MKFRATMLFMIVTVLTLGAALAQDAPPPPPDPAAMAQHQVQYFTALLSLTSAQQQQALTLFTNAASSESPLHQQDRAAHETLEAAVRNNDGASISQAATTIGNLAAQRAEIHARAEAAFYQVLTPSQQSKLTQLKSLGPGFGFGPPPGPRP